MTAGNKAGKTFTLFLPPRHPFLKLSAAQQEVLLGQPVEARVRKRFRGERCIRNRRSRAS